MVDSPRSPFLIMLRIADIISALSFGCAGFNTVLGPIRPTFVAFTILAQISSWYVAYPRRYQWKATAASTALSVFLTLIPELLAWRTAKRVQLRKQLHDGQFDDLLLDCDSASGITLQFCLGTMGCASCLSTVSKVLDGIEGVLSHRVRLEDGLAEVLLTQELLASMNGMNTEAKHDLLWKDIAKQLEGAGFGAEEYSNSKKERSHVGLVLLPLFIT